MYPYLSIRSSLFIISCAKLLHKLVKPLLCIIFPDYVHSTKLVYVRCYFEAAIASIFIFFKPCSDERQNGFKLFKTKTK